LPKLSSSRTSFSLFERKDIGLIDYYYTKKNAQKQTVKKCLVRTFFFGLEKND